MKAEKRLPSLFIQNVRTPGRYHDGGGLYLQVSKNVTKSWEFRYTFNGHTRFMGLGSVRIVSLAEARNKIIEKKQLLLNGVDPIDERRRIKTQFITEKARTVLFSECAHQYIKAKKSEWKNAKHAAQWTSTMEQYAFPVVGNLPVSQIDQGLVMKILEPIWKTKTETATRVRNRIELILNWATVRGYRHGENPARWRGHLDMLLPKPSAIRKVVHHTALRIQDMPVFMQRLRTQEIITALALEFLILTATRTNETLEATWSEIDFDEKLWTIPAERMKNDREHRVPLSDDAVLVLRRVSNRDDNSYIFRGLGMQKHLSNAALLQLLKRMKVGVTSHGFRSTFRDWAAEKTSHSHEVAEMALSHTIKNKVEAAYRRGDLLEKRRLLMNEWALFCRQDLVAQGKRPLDQDANLT